MTTTVDQSATCLQRLTNKTAVAIGSFSPSSYQYAEGLGHCGKRVFFHAVNTRGDHQRERRRATLTVMEVWVIGYG